MADPNLFHEPEAFDAVEGMFERILGLLENINEKVAGGSSKGSTPSHKAGYTSSASHEPDSADKPVDFMSKVFGNIGKHLGIETKAQAIDRIDRNQAKVEKDVNIDEIKGRLYEARAGSDPVAEAQANKDLAAARAQLQKTVEVVPDKANVDWGQFGKGASDFIKVFGQLLHFADGGVVPGGPRAPGPTDTVPAMLTPGERVLSLDEVQRLGGLGRIDHMVKGGPKTEGPKHTENAPLSEGSAPLGFAKGGTVPDDAGFNYGAYTHRLSDIAKNAGSAMQGDPLAIAKVGVDTIMMTVDNLKAIGGHMMGMKQSVDKVMGTDRAEDILGGAAEGGLHAGKAVAHAVGGPVLGPILAKMMDFNPITLFQKALAETIGTIRRWGDQLHEANMKFAEFSAQMANVQARQQFRDIRLSRTRGNRRAESAEDLAETRHGLNQRFAVFEDAVAIFKNNVVSGLNRLTSFTLDAAPIIGPLMRALSKYMGDEKPDPGFAARLMEIARKYDEEQKRRRRGGR